MEKSTYYIEGVEGMAQTISKINVDNISHEIGGDIANGQWVYSSLAPFASNPFTGTGTQDIDVSNYLPENNVWYEILWMSWSSTGTTSGNSSDWRISYRATVGSTTTPDYTQIAGYVTTRTSSNVVCGNCGVLPVKQDSNGIIPLRFTVNSNPSNCGIQFKGYRKVGTNG